MDLFQSCGHCWVFQICWHIECSTLTASSFRIWNSSIGIPSPPLALFIVMLSKAYLTSHSRMSGSRWVITPSWLSGSWRSFSYSTSMFTVALFTIAKMWKCQASVCSLVLVSSQQWFRETDIKALGASRLSSLGQISVTALFYLEDSRRILPWRREEWRSVPALGRWEGGRGCGDREKERSHAGEREWARLPPPFVCFLPLGLPYANWAQPGVLFTWSPHSGPRTFLWLSFVLFSMVFPSLVF